MRGTNAKALRRAASVKGDGQDILEVASETVSTTPRNIRTTLRIVGPWLYGGKAPNPTRKARLARRKAEAAKRAAGVDSPAAKAKAAAKAEARAAKVSP